MRAIATDGAHAVPPLGDHHGRRLQLRRRRRGGGRGDGPARDRLPRGLRPRRSRALDRFEELRERVEPRALRPRRASACRRTRRTRARSSCTRRAPRLGLPDRDAPRGERRRARRSSSTARATGPSFAEMLVPPPGHDGHPHAGRGRPARPGRRGGALRARRATTRSRCSPQHGVGVAHCPRSNGLLGCGVAPARTSSSRRGSRVGIATDSPASTPSFDLFEELRTAIVAARARERRPDALTAAHGARARDARRRPRPRARRRASARSCPASGPT